MFSQLFTFFAASCEPKSFLGLVPWYQYLDYGETTIGGKTYCGVRDFNLLPKNGNSDLPLILLAVVDDLIRLAGLVAVIFVVFGAIQYATSQGNPDQASKAQSTIINAIIGVVIAIVAVGFVSFLGRTLTR